MSSMYISSLFRHNEQH